MYMCICFCKNQQQCKNNKLTTVHLASGMGYPVKGMVILNSSPTFALMVWLEGRRSLLILGATG